MKKVTLSKSSWHGRLMNWTWGSETTKVYANYCPYFWLLLFTIAVSPITFVTKCFNTGATWAGTLLNDLLKKFPQIPRAPKVASDQAEYNQAALLWSQGRRWWVIQFAHGAYGPHRKVASRLGYPTAPTGYQRWIVENAETIAAELDWKPLYGGNKDTATIYATNYPYLFLDSILDLVDSETEWQAAQQEALAIEYAIYMKWLYRSGIAATATFLMAALLAPTATMTLVLTVIVTMLGLSTVLGLAILGWYIYEYAKGVYNNYCPGIVWTD